MNDMTDEQAGLTPAERALIGSPADWVTEGVVPARPKSATTMFSLRVDRRTFDALSDIAARRGLTFSEVARDALRQYVDSGGRLISISTHELTVEAETVRLVGPKVSDRRPTKVASGRRQAGLATSG
jgi:antitoxin component of RelBE/YafQ-DinJ toxin-antitoxin module